MSKTCHFAPNGKPSKLYNELAKNYGANFAEEVFVRVHSPEFRQNFGDWRTFADTMLDKTPKTLQYKAMRSSFGKEGLIDETTFEPKVFYYSGDRELVTGKGLVSQIEIESLRLIGTIKNLPLISSFMDSLSFNVFEASVLQQTDREDRLTKLLEKVKDRYNELSQQAKNIAEGKSKEAAELETTVDQLAELEIAMDKLTIIKNNLDLLSSDYARGIMRLYLSNEKSSIELADQLMLGLEQGLVDEGEAVPKFSLSKEYSVGAFPVFINAGNLPKSNITEALQAEIPAFEDSETGETVVIDPSVLLSVDTGKQADLLNDYLDKLQGQRIITEVIKKMDSNIKLNPTQRLPVVIKENGDLIVNPTKFKANSRKDFQLLYSSLIITNTFKKNPQFFSNYLDKILNEYSLENYESTGSFADSVLSNIVTFLKVEPEFDGPKGKLMLEIAKNYHAFKDFGLTSSLLPNHEAMKLRNKLRIEIGGESFEKVAESNLETKDIYKAVTNRRKKGIMGAPAPGGSMTSTILDHHNLARLDESPKMNEGKEVLKTFTRVPEKNHTYYIGDVIVDKSITKVKEEYEDHKFDQNELINNYIPDSGTVARMLTSYNKDDSVNEKESAEKRATFVRAARFNNISLFTEKYPFDQESWYTQIPEKADGETDEDYKEKVEKVRSKNQKFINELAYVWDFIITKQTDIEIRGLAGTRMHSIMEAVLKEDSLRNEKDYLILEQLANVSDTMIEMEKSFQDFLNGNPEQLENIRYIRNLNKSIKQLESSLAKRKNAKKEQELKSKKQLRDKFIKEYKEKVLDPFKAKFPTLESVIKHQDKEYSAETKVLKVFNNLNKNFLENKVKAEFESAKLKGDVNYEEGFSSIYGTIEEYTTGLSTHIIPFQRVYSGNEFHEMLLSIKESIKKKGGTILTEITVHTDKIHSIDGSYTFNTAGMIDVLAVYEDADHVDPEFRGTVEIYDLKTMREAPVDNDKFWKTTKSGKKYGFLPGKKSQYALQLLLYKRILEEELGLTVKDAFVIPLHTPVVNLSTHRFDARFKPIKFTKNLFRGQNPFTINIKAFKREATGRFVGFDPKTGKAIYSGEFGGYGKNLDRSYERIPRDARRRFSNENISEGAKTRMDLNDKRKNTKLNTLVEDIQIHIEKRLKRLRQQSNEDTDKALKTKLNKLRNDLEDFDNLGKVIRFISDAHSELLGEQMGNNERIVGLEEVFYNIVDAYLDPETEMDLGSSINDLDLVRIYAENYQILDEIKKNLDEETDPEKLNKIKNSEEYKKLEEAIVIKNKIIDDFYFYSNMMIADRLAKYISTNATIAAKQHFEAVEARRNSEIKNLKEKLQELKDSGAEPHKLNAVIRKINALQKRKGVRDPRLKQLTITAETIRDSLEQLPRDVAWYEKLFISPVNSSDSIMALYSKMVKFEISDADLRLKRKAVEMEVFLETIREKIGSKRGLKNNTEEFFEPMLEKVWKWQFNPETKRLEFVETLSFVSEFGIAGTIEVELENEDGTTEVKTYEVDYVEMDRHYKYKLNKLKKEAQKLKDSGESEKATENSKKYRELLKEYKKWLNDNFEPLYTEKYYELDNILSDDTQGVINKIDEQINNIKDGSTAGDMYLTDDEIDQINRLKFKKRILASKYDENGKLKTDPEQIRMAEEITEYNKKFAELHDFDKNKDLFEYKRTEARQKFIENPIEYLKWLSRNENTELTEEFYDKYFRLKMQKDLIFFATLNDEQELLNFLRSEATYYMSDKEFLEQAKKTLKSLNLETRFENRYKSDDNSYKLDAMYEEINDLLKPFRKGGMSYSVEYIPDTIKKRVLQLEQRIMKIKNLQKGGELDEDNIQELIEALEARESYAKALDEFAQQKTTHEYEIERAKALEEHNKLKAKTGAILAFEQSSWFKENHVYNEKNKQWEPLRFWLQVYPVDYTPTLSKQYYIDRAEKKEALRAKFPSATDAFLETELKKTDWYQTYHTINPENNLDVLTSVGERIYFEPQEDNTYIKVEPGERFNKVTVKNGEDGGENFLRDPEKVYDKMGRRIPKKGKWKNKKYEALQKDTVLGPLYNKLMDLYYEAQELLPEAHQMGNTVPFIRKTKKERRQSGDNVFKTSMNILKDIKERNITSSTVIDIEEEGGLDEEGVKLSNYDIDDKFIPMMYTTYQKPDDVSHDVVSGVMQFMKSAYKHEALSNILGETRTLVALLNRREGKEGLGTIENSSDGNKILQGVAKKLGFDRFVRKEGMGNAASLFISFVEMQVFNEMSNPIEFNFPLFGKDVSIRMDKVADSIMGLASISQIGGLNIMGAMKGMTNLLQAEIQLKIERIGGKFFGKAKWKEAGFYLSAINVWEDVFNDFGRATAITKSGQLFDIYDALQGSFRDEFGKQVSAKRAWRLMSTNTWFFNQYVGEFRVAMRSLYATLMNMKVDEKGNVYNQQDWLSKKAADKGYFLEETLKDGSTKFTLDSEGNKIGDYSQLSEMELIEAKAEHEKMDNTLLDNIYVDEKTKQLKIKDGVKWQFGSFRDNEMKSRLHAINKQLHGAYNNFDTPVIERGLLGRLLTMYKKYLAPAVRRRFGKMQRDEELGDIHVGYYRNFWSIMMKDSGKLLRNWHNIMFNRKVATGFSELEKANIRRASSEILIILALQALTMILAPKEDEDKDEISSARWAMLYHAKRLRRELTALTPTPWAIGDNWKILRSPSAITGFTDRFLKFLLQTGNPLARYKQDSGIAEKGDLKLYIKFRKLLGTIGIPALWEHSTIREAYDNINRNL